MNLDTHEIEHLLWLVETFGCKSEHSESHSSECERLHNKLSAIKVATETFWSEIKQKDIKLRV